MIIVLNIDNYMDDLISKYSEKDIQDALTRATKKKKDNLKKAEITDARSKVLAALTQYFIAVFGKADKDLVKEFENELITIEGKVAESSGEPEKKVKTMVIDDATDDEKLRRFVDDLFKF